MPVLKNVRFRGQSRHSIIFAHKSLNATATPRYTRQAVDNYLRANPRTLDDFMFVGWKGRGRPLTTRQYARLVSQWVTSVSLDASLFGTHSLRRTKATLIYRRTGNLRAVQLLLGHTKIESTVRYLGIEVDDALDIAEKVDI